MMVIDEQCRQLFASRLVHRVKAGEQRAVEIEHAEDLAGYSREDGEQRQDELGA